MFLFVEKNFLSSKPIRNKKTVRGDSSSANSSKSLQSRGTRDSGPRLGWLARLTGLRTWREQTQKNFEKICLFESKNLYGATRVL